MPQSEILEDWKRRVCVLATMHAKEKIVAPLFSKELGIHVTVPTNFNTDRFGTFTRDIPRLGDQLDAARKKALAGIVLTGTDLALASEGSFGVHPDTPFLPSNVEIVLMIDVKNKLEIVGQYRTSDIRVRGQKVYTPDEAVLVACSWGFPEQGVIVRSSEKSNRYIHKEITDKDELRMVTKKLLSRWFTKSVFLETDMRAHRCPARMHSIQEATRDLIKNCQSLCPQCSTPGFVVTEVLQGLPCSGCGAPTDHPSMLVYSCKKCLTTIHKKVDGAETVDPGECIVCNP